MSLSLKIKSTSLLAVILLSGNVLANELQMKPGLWKSKTTQVNPMTQQTETVEDTECVSKEKAKLSVKSFIKDMKDAGECKAIKDELKGDTLSMELECTNPMGKSKISGKITSHGDKADSEMKIEMSFQGQKMTMSMSSTSEWVGECSEES